MSAQIANRLSRNLKMTAVKGVSRSGPFKSVEFKHTPPTFAAASQTRRTFPGLFGFLTGKTGRYHHFVLLRETSSGDSFRA